MKQVVEKENRKLLNKEISNKHSQYINSSSAF